MFVYTIQPVVKAVASYKWGIRRH